MCFLINTTMFRISATCTDTWDQYCRFLLCASSYFLFCLNFLNWLIFYPMYDLQTSPRLLCKLQAAVALCFWLEQLQSGFWCNTPFVTNFTRWLQATSRTHSPTRWGLYIFHNQYGRLHHAMQIMGWIEYEPLFKRASLSVFKTYVS